MLRRASSIIKNPCLISNNYNNNSKTSFKATMLFQRRNFGWNSTTIKNCDHRNQIFMHNRWMGSASAVISTTGTIPGVLSKKQAKELAVRLTSDERQVLIDALQECQSHKIKAEFEGK